MSTVSKPAPIRLTMPSVGQRRDDALGDRRVLEQDAGAARARRRSRRPRSCTARSTSSTPAAANSVALELEVGIVVVGEEDFGHGGSRVERTRRGRPATATRNGTWRRGDWSSGLTDSGRTASPAAAHYNRRARRPRPAPPVRRTSAMTKLLQTTIAGSLPKPAWLADARRSCGRRGGSRATRSPRASATPCASRCATRSTPASTSSPTASRRAAISSRRSSRPSTASTSQHKKTVRIRNRYDADVPVVVGPGRAPASGLRRRRARSCAARPTARSSSRCPAR